MSIRGIAKVGHPVLRQRAREVSREELGSDATQRLIDDLVETMHEANGAGLAAPQIHEDVRICALHVEHNPRYPYKPNIPLQVLVNPELTVIGDETFMNFEGCLSVPDLRGEVERHACVQIRALDRHGEPLEFEARGITAGTYQHEIDHLDGVLFLDRVKDPRTLSTWAEFERHHKAAFVERVRQIVARYGS